jgi:hypothetical protein
MLLEESSCGRGGSTIGARNWGAARFVANVKDSRSPRSQCLGCGQRCVCEGPAQSAQRVPLDGHSLRERRAASITLRLDTARSSSDLAIAPS